MDRRAVQKLYEMNGNSLYRLCCFYMKNEQDAFDAMQNTYLKLLEHETPFESDAHARNWLLRVASNECKNMLRHWWYQTVSVDDCVLTSPNNTESYVEKQALLQEIMKLPKMSRVTLYLYYYEGYSTIEIAEILSMKESSVRSNLLRGRRNLQLELTEECHERT